MNRAAGALIGLGGLGFAGMNAIYTGTSLISKLSLLF